MNIGMFKLYIKNFNNYETIKIYYIDTRGKLAVNLIRIFNSNYRGQL